MGLSASAGGEGEGASGSAFHAFVPPPTPKPLRAVIHHVEEEAGEQGLEGSSQDVGEWGGNDYAPASSLRAPRVRVRFEAPSAAAPASGEAASASAAAAAAAAAATPAPVPQTPALQYSQQQLYPQKLQGTLGGASSLPGTSMPPTPLSFAQPQQLPPPKSVLVPVPDPTGRSPFILVPLLSEHGQPVSAPLRQPATPSAASAFTAVAIAAPPPPPPLPQAAEWGYPAPSSLPARSGR